MLTIILEIARTILLGVLSLYLFLKGKNTTLAGEKGWNFLIIGASLLFMGSLIDITDEFPSLASTVVFGPTETQAILEKIIGYSLGSLFLFLGFAKLLPIILRVFAMEKELKLANENLEERIKTRTEELENAKIAAECANRAKTDFLARMSHEVRTPLNVINGMAHILESDLQGKKEKERVTKIINSATGLLGIFNNILDYSNLDSGITELNIGKFETSKLCDSLYDEYAPFALAKGINLRITSKKKIPEFLEGDYSAIKKLAQIFIDNAIKFTREGSVEIYIAFESNKLVCSVADTGIGISEKSFEVISDFFSQLEDNSTRRYGGIGLGLALAEKLLRLVDGSLEVTSKKNIGSKFTLSVPIRKVDKKEVVVKLNTEEKNKECISDRKGNELSLNSDNLTELEKLLENDDADSLMFVEKIVGEINHSRELNELIAEIQCYNFEKALEIVKCLKER